MALSINTNIMSLNAQRNLTTSQGSMKVSLQRLSSGLRINSAADDAAGMAVSQRMLGQIKSLNQAVRNANDGISMIQTAEGGMQEIQTMLQRMRELSTQAASDTISDTERGYVDVEIQALKTEINAISDRTKFNGQALLTGNLVTQLGGATATELVVGDTITANVMVTDIDVSNALASDTFTFTYDTTSDVLTLTRGSDNVGQNLSLAAMTANQTVTHDFSALGVKVTLQADVTGETADNIGAALIAGADDAILTTGAGSAATVQIGADAGAGNTLTLAFNNVKIDTVANGADATLDALNTALINFNGSNSRADASLLLAAVDTATDFISSERAALGAVQNRMQHTIANLLVTSENVSSARSIIVDADFATETANLTRTQILQQAGVAMLAQANSLPQNVLALLQ